MTLIVVKLGGSLLQRPTFVTDVRQWLHDDLDRRFPGAIKMIVVGGGRLVDVVRDWDRTHPMPSEAFPVFSEVVHWQCVELLKTTFALTAMWFPDWRALRSPIELHGYLRRGANNFDRCKNILVSPACFYQQNADETNDSLPTDWRTTTDSIAALLAATVAADRLVILKSCDIPADSDLRQLIRQGILDEAFLGAATGQPIFPAAATDVRQLPPS